MIKAIWKESCMKQAREVQSATSLYLAHPTPLDAWHARGAIDGGARPRLSALPGTWPVAQIHRAAVLIHAHTT